MNDPINPNHYQDIVPGLQYIQVMEHVLKPRQALLDELRAAGIREELVQEVEALPYIGLLMGQGFKYYLRFGKKDNILQEAKKGAWYFDYLVNFLERMGFPR
jgi:hypothetical protein